MHRREEKMNEMKRTVLKRKRKNENAKLKRKQEGEQERCTLSNAGCSTAYLKMDVSYCY